MPMPRPQFTLRALLMAILVVAAFVERERRRHEDEAAAFVSIMRVPSTAHKKPQQAATA